MRRPLDCSVTSRMTPSTAFVIAGSSHVAALRRRLEHDPTVTVFSESESLDALRLIMEHPPTMLAFDAAIVNTARGALIVSRLREQNGVDVRVLCEDEAHMPLLLASDELALHSASHPIAECGTRGARRFPIRSDVEVTVGGERSLLVNLSVTGAQLVLPARVQPQQSIRVTLVEAETEQRLSALVAWSTVELAKSRVKYRAGVSFVNPDTGAIEAFCVRNCVA
jgi:PilZ domain